MKKRALSRGATQHRLLFGLAKSTIALVLTTSSASRTPGGEAMRSRGIGVDGRSTGVDIDMVNE